MSQRMASLPKSSTAKLLLTSPHYSHILPMDVLPKKRRIECEIGHFNLYRSLCDTTVDRHEESDCMLCHCIRAVI